MEKKRPKGITLLGRIETILGMLGTILLVWMIIAGTLTYFLAKGEARMGLLGTQIIPWFIPFPLLMFTGIGILKLRSWARRTNIILFSILLILTLIVAILLTFAQHAHGFYVPEVAGLFWLILFMTLISLLIIYLVHSKVKEQFK